MDTFKSWPVLGPAQISDDGKFISYTIENNADISKETVIKSTENNWKREFKNVALYPVINKTGEYAFFINPHDSLVIISLGKDLIQYIPEVRSFKITGTQKNEWLVYQSKKSDKELILKNLNTETKRKYHGVLGNFLCEDGRSMVLRMDKSLGNKIAEELRWIDIDMEKNTLIWTGKSAENIILDSKYKQMAFIANDSIFYFKDRSQNIVCLGSCNSLGIDTGLKLAEILRFSSDGTMLLISMKQRLQEKPTQGVVELWSYRDHKLQSQQEKDIVERTYVFAIDLLNRKTLRLEKKWEKVSINNSRVFSDTIGLINYQESDGASRETHWNTICKNENYLVSLRNGQRIKMDYFPTLSPKGKFAVYFDEKQECFISYNIKTGVYRNIFKGVKESYKVEDWERKYEGIISGWIEDDTSVILYDKYDIWLLDLLGKKPPINLTKGFGRKNQIAFSIIYNDRNSPILKSRDKVVLSGFNLITKQNGFFKLELGGNMVPELLSSGNYIYDTKTSFDYSFTPIKAKNSKRYLVRRMSADTAPNYFVTDDFKSFKKQTDLHPEKDYNWYRTELHTWKSLDGRSLQGILYKPENFDPHTEYPVIFYYYERKSDELNAYLSPQVLGEGGGTINIPMYVSNGYLVFVPDIYYKIGDPMQGTYDAVISAAKYVSALPFVKKNKIGLQGNSFGGIQTNYLVTHSDMFAAACSSSGMANWVSNYGKLGSEGASLQGFAEVGQLRMGASLWEKPEAYIKMSSIFYLNRVTTPLLIMHTKKDGICAYSDAIELFTGLRRLGKRAWMLAYSEGNHGLYGREAKDFSIRMMQFFDHYLKGKAAPLWMIDGIPASRRGIDNGLALDTSGRVPGPGLLIIDEQKKVDSLLNRKPITITIP